MKLYLHIGLHKTGTSFIQKILNYNKELLNTIYNINLIKFNHKLWKYNNNNLKEVLDINIVENKINLISFEFLLPFTWLHKIHNYKDDIFKKNLNSLVNILKQKYINIDIHFIITLREQISYLESYYFQIVKTDNKYINFNDFINDINLYDLNYYELINSLIDVVGEKNVHYIWYENIFRINGEKYYIELFLNIITNKNINVEIIDFSKINNYMFNVSPDIKVIDEFYNKNIVEKKVLRKKYQSEKNINYYKNLFDQKLKSTLMEYYKPSNEKLNIIYYT